MAQNHNAVRGGSKTVGECEEPPKDNAPRAEAQARPHSGIFTTLKDPLVLLRQLSIHLYSLWVSKTYPFSAVGSNLIIHYRSDLSKSHAHRIKLGRSVFLDKDSQLRVQVPLEEEG